MSQVTRRTILQRGSLLGGLLALDAVRPAFAATRPAASPRSAGAIDAALHGGVSRNDVAGALFTQGLPFYDERVVALYGAFERELYAGLA